MGARAELEHGGPRRIGAGRTSQHRPQDCGKRGNEEWEAEKRKIIHVLANAIQSCSSVRNQYFFVQRIHLFRKNEIALFDDARGRLNSLNERFYGI